MAKPLPKSEMVEILNEIARDGRNGAARIAAIRTLKEWGEDQSEATGFDALDDEIAAKRKQKAAA